MVGRCNYVRIRYSALEEEFLPETPRSRRQTARRFTAICNGGADTVKDASPSYVTTYHAIFGRSTSNGVGISRGVPQNWGALGPCPVIRSR